MNSDKLNPKLISKFFSILQKSKYVSDANYSTIKNNVLISLSLDVSATSAAANCQSVKLKGETETTTLIL